MQYQCAVKSRGTSELLQRGKMSGRILKLFKELPPLQYVGIGHADPDITQEGVIAAGDAYSMVFPEIIATHLKFFVKNHKKDLVDLIVNGYYYALDCVKSNLLDVRRLYVT